MRTIKYIPSILYQTSIRKHGEECPYVHDNVVVDIDGVEISFNPSEYGFDKGYYCSLSMNLSGHIHTFNFDDCACPSLRYCDGDWGNFNDLVDAHETKLNIVVGKCQVDAWAMIIPVVLSMLMTLAIIKTCTYYITKRTTPRVIRADPDYVSLE